MVHSKKHKKSFDASNDAELRQLADTSWADKREASKETEVLIHKIYFDHLKGKYQDYRRQLSLELTRVLENVFWPCFSPEYCSKEHILSIALMINTKVRERVHPWEAIEEDATHVTLLFRRVSQLLLEDTLSTEDRIILLLFWSHSINSIERDVIRQEVQRYISLGMWISLSDKRRDKEFKDAPKLKKFWNLIHKKDKTLDAQKLEDVMFERKFLSSLIQSFFKILHSIPNENDTASLDSRQLRKVNFCERLIEFVTDIEALLPTRRFFNALLDDLHVIVFCRRSNLFRRKTEGKLFRQLLEMLVFYARFEIDDLTGDALSLKDMSIRHSNKIFDLQKLVFKDFPEEMRKFYLSSIASVSTRDQLLTYFSNLEFDQLKTLCVQLGIIDQETEDCDKTELLESIAFVYEKHVSQLESLNQLPLYPTEAVVWDENLVPQEVVSGDQCLALPKLNLQFLTLHDYLLRNFHLFRLEATYEIRQDIEDAVFRLKPWKREDGKIMFGGWARMALPIDSLTIVEVKKPNIGERHPSRVRAEVRVNLSVKRDVKSEWEGLRKHDVCFLISLDPPNPPGTMFKYNQPFIPQVGLKFIRGCEVEGMLDPSGKLIDEGSEQQRFSFDTDYRTYRVWLDPNQYGEDTEQLKDESDTLYDSINVIVRRKPEENNFKAVLETIRDLMNTKCVVPEWIHDVLLGFGDPSAAHPSQLPSSIKTLDFRDTFLGIEHLQASFPGQEVLVKGNNEKQPPFKIEKTEEGSLQVIPYVTPSRGPYPFVQPKKNSIRFTPTQVEAIESGMKPGLTVIVGPPGTGKTDVAVQIISNIYHNFPNQRTLIVTHSNQALNQLFEKIMQLDVDERHLLRLGHGQEALETEKNFTRYGRVNYVLQKRILLLHEVQKLAKSLDLPVDAGHTCETAGYFFLYHIISRWELFMSQLTESSSSEDVQSKFPFKKFFEDAPQPLFKGKSFQDDLETAKGCYRYIKKIFTQLEEFRAFEIIRTGAERSRYLLLKEAKVIAMTCTHAALKRKELVDLGFQYDNILMEEAAQILEIETFIPLLLQDPLHGHNRLKRWIMIGDHHQLPPVVKNMVFQKYCNLEQSLFTRFVRLGVPTVDLDAQGRARSSICDLYRWRYKNLGDLSHVLNQQEFMTTNAGLAFDYQFINVDDFNGVGESEPVPYFYQNLAEAEYAVALFMYLRLIGYPREKITILTTYNGQKSLLRDVVGQRCSSNPLIGEPAKITTVDKFQGQQNDIIILSLVRTKTVGHLRDVRRLVVAVSRARLGLYIFGRSSVFRYCHELRPAFDRMLKRPQQLHLLPNEEYPSVRSIMDPVPKEKVKIIESMPEMLEFVFNFYAIKIEDWKKTRPQFLEQIFSQNKKPDEAMETEVVQEGDPTTEGAKTALEEDVEGEEELGFEKLTEDDEGGQDPDPDLEMEET